METPRRITALRAVVATFVLFVLPVLGVVAAPPGVLGAAPAPAFAGERPADGGRLVQVELDGRVVQLVADGDSTCALTDAGEVYCWGAKYPDPYRSGVNALMLVALGSLLVAGGATLLLLSRTPVDRRPGPETGPPPA